MKKVRKYVILLIVTVLALVTFVSACTGVPNVVNTPSDVQGRTIGALAGTPSIRFASDLGTAVAYHSTIDMMNDLRAGIIDCVIMESTSASELVSATSGVRILADPLVEYELRVGVPKENRALLDAVDEAIDFLQGNGTLRRIRDRYFARRDFPAYAEDDDEAYGLEHGGYLTVALPADSPPFSFRNAQGRMIGMDVEVAIAIGEYLGVGLRVIETDVWDLVNAVWTGRADLALGWHPGEGYGIINMSEPYAHAVHVVIVRR